MSLTQYIKPPHGSLVESALNYLFGLIGEIKLYLQNPIGLYIHRFMQYSLQYELGELIKNSMCLISRISLVACLPKFPVYSSIRLGAHGP